MKRAPAQRDRLLILLFGAIYALMVLFIDNSYQQLIIAVVPIWAVMGLSWNLLSGYSGLISFGHAAFFGLGAYAVALGVVNWGLIPWLGIPMAAVLGALAGLIIGLPTFRLRGHYFALAMLAYPLAFLYIFEWLGYQELALPRLEDSPIAYMQFADGRIHAIIALALLIGAMLVTSFVERSRFGMSLLAIKQDEAAAEAAGINSLAWKLRTIAASGAMAAAAGGFYAIVLLVVTPSAVFGMLISAQALIVAMFGGVATLWGPVIGAIVLVPLSEFLHAELANVVPGIQGVIYGLAIIGVILLAPDGVFWRLRDMVMRRVPETGPKQADQAADTPSPGRQPERPPVDRTATMLEAYGLSKAFGGVHAVQDVSLQVFKGEILGIIGPNGAGKTTLFNLLNGFDRPDRGDVRFKGDSILGRKPHRICTLGLGRTFQVAKPFPRMSVLENVTVGAYVHTRTDDEARARARDALVRVGLAGKADMRAGGLPTRDLRLMEMARALAGAPAVLLMDEPLAGLGTTETEDVIAVIRHLAADGLTIVVIEHTMQAMVRLVDRFVVLDHGSVLADGAPDAITQDPAVIEAYLGKKWRRDA